VVVSFSFSFSFFFLFFYACDAYSVAVAGNISYELPDGQIMNFPRRLCAQACENLFFSPHSSLSSDSSACLLVEMCTRLLRACPHELREAIASNVVLAGGTVCKMLPFFVCIILIR
jgi:hypothetical protein